MKFADAQKKMIEYLDSKEFKEREDAEDTVSSIPILQRIIKHGLITTGSQEGTISTGFNPDSKRFYRIEERAFIIGCMKPEKAYESMNYINTYTDKIGFIIRSEPSKAFKKEFFEGDVKGLSSIPVTVSGTSKTNTQIKVMHPETSLQTILPSSIIDEDKKKAGLSKSEDTVFVTVIDPVYGRKAATKQGLYKAVLDALKALN
jgi:hypothetical protein